MLSAQTFDEFYSKGLRAIPVTYNAATKTVTSYPEHVTDTKDGLGVPSLEDVHRWMRGMKTANGVAIKLFPPFGMLDFDLKNTANKDVYTRFIQMIDANDDEVLRKVCVETTRNGGYHMYIKYPKLSQKTTLARAHGSEVISVYTGGLLSFCYPTPDYNLIHNEFADIEELTDDEYELLISCATYFNEDEEAVWENNSKPIDYPTQYESTLIQFDTKCTDDAFHGIINSIGLHSLANDLKFARKKYTAYLRIGSSAAYSAKAYFKSKILLIFSGSMSDFPNFQNRLHADDDRWRLSPSMILYYKNKASWPNAIAELKAIAESAGIEITEPAPASEQSLIPPDRLKFPYDVLPEALQHYIRINPIQNEYMGAAALVAMSAAIGNSVTLEASDGYFIKPVLYMAIVAPPGASKSPALKTIFARIEKQDAHNYAQYIMEDKEYREQMSTYRNQKKGEDKKEPALPIYKQILIKDSTIEKTFDTLFNNQNGCCVLADELSGFIRRMNKYGDKTDEMQKWLEFWSASPSTMQRVGSGTKRIEEPFCSIVGGIQPGVLDIMSSNQNKEAGFFHRFLFVYPEVQPKKDWAPFVIPLIIKESYNELFFNLMKMRTERTAYELSTEADDLYARWFNHKNKYYNVAQDDDTKGIISKYQDYCLRFALLLQAAHEGRYRSTLVSPENMERAIRLTEYFLGNMNKAMRVLTPQSPVDKLQPPYSTLYNKLPNNFTTATAVEIGACYQIKSVTVRAFINRNIRVLFTQVSRGKYERMY